MTEQKWRSAIKEEEVEKCLEWLLLQDMVVTPNKKLHSYHLKHVIENYYDTYISEASLVEAFVRSGVPFKEVDTFSRVREPDGSLSRRSYSIYPAISLKTVRYYSNRNKNII